MIQFESIYEFKNPLVSAASGLILAGEEFHLVADDGLSMLSLPRSLNGRARMTRLFEGEMPQDPKERKKAKPDLESLVFLPDSGSILCIPSGSTPERHRGAMVGEQGRVDQCSFKTVFQFLGQGISELNIEGAVIFDRDILLFQRGNGAIPKNGLISLNLESFLRDEVSDFSWTAIDLGSVHGVPFGFTDASRVGDQIWFLAAAESGASRIEDGAFQGSLIGKMSRDGRVLFLDHAGTREKPEGLHVIEDQAFVVTDADHPETPSVLYRGQLPQS